MQGHAGAINNPLRLASYRLVQVHSVSSDRATQSGMSGNILIIGAIITEGLLLF